MLTSADHLDSARRLVGLMYTAPERFTSIEAAGRSWIKPAGRAEAEREWLAAQEPGSVAALTPAESDGKLAQPTGALLEEIVDLRVRKSSSQGFHTETLDRQGDPMALGSLDYQTMLRPLAVIPHISITSMNEAAVEGRRAVRLRAKPRLHDIDVSGSSLWNLADECELLVDRERGVLLRLNSLHNGKAFAGEELGSVRFDPPVPGADARRDLIAEVAGLLYVARYRFSTMRLTMRQWLQEQPTGWRPWPSGGRSATETTSQLWIDNPSRFRKVTSGGARVLIEHLVIGDSWWDYYGSGLVTTNTPRARVPGGAKTPIRERRGAPMYENAERAIISQTLLEPSWLMAGLWMKTAARTSHAGRDAIRVEAEPVEGRSDDWWWWKGADEYVLIVDAERGTLLRIEVRRNGKEFAGVEALDIEFDSPIAEDVFDIK